MHGIRLETSLHQSLEVPQQQHSTLWFWILLTLFLDYNLLKVNTVFLSLATFQNAVS